MATVKTSRVDESIHVFEGPAFIMKSQDEAISCILEDQIKAGDVVIVH